MRSGLNMQPGNLAMRFFKALIRPRQVMIMDSASVKAAKNWRVRLITVLLIPIIFTLLGLTLGHFYLSGSQVSNILPQYVQLQRQYKLLRDKLATSQANNDIKNARIESLESANQQQQHNTSLLKERVTNFESILDARKMRGVQILQAKLHASKKDVISFYVSLVKGGNYPRHVRGNIQFIAKDKMGENIIFNFENGRNTLPYDMETHTLLHGNISVPNATVLDTQSPITLILRNHKGKELSRKTCIIKELI